ALDRVLARAALVHWLPPNLADDIVSEAERLVKTYDCVRALAEMTPNLPAQQLERVGRLLVTSAWDTLKSNHFNDIPLLRQGLRALSCALAQHPSPELMEQALALACSDELSEVGRVE